MISLFCLARAFPGLLRASVLALALLISIPYERFFANRFLRENGGDLREGRRVDRYFEVIFDARKLEMRLFPVLFIFEGEAIFECACFWGAFEVE